MEGAPAMVLLRFFVNILALAVIMTVVYNGTGGSLPLMVMFHWLTNLPYPGWMAIFPSHQP